MLQGLPRTREEIRQQLEGGYGVGRPVVTPRFDEAGPFSEGVAVVRVDHQTIFVDGAGNPAFSETFRAARPFSDGLAAVRIEYHWVYIRRSNAEVVIDREFKGAEAFEGGLARVYFGGEDNPRIGYIDRTGAYVWYPTR